MAKKNSYMAKKRATERAFFDAGLQMGRQQIIDMLCLVLHDPEVMGKDTFGRERLKKVVAAIGKKIDYYHKAWLKKDDTDAYREGLDNALADAFGEESLKDSFLKRYEYSPEYDYLTNKWKGLSELNVLSLFDGMACGMLAMMSAGIPVDRYVAFEIDKYAVQASTHNFPMIEHRGDVFQADFSEFSGFDILCGGSPCTYWSIAQKNNRETEASGMGWELFSQYVRALKEAKPRFFIYENNKSMSAAIRESISTAFGFEPICINSALVSAQNRNRLYWVGKRNEDGTYSPVDVPQPEDRGIMLKDILEGGYDLTNKDKSFCLTATYDGACPWNTIERSQRNMVAEPVCVAERGRYGADGIEQHFEARLDGKTNVLTTVSKDNQICEPVRVGCLPSPDGSQRNSQAFRLYSDEGKSVNLTAQGGGAGAKTGLYTLEVPMYAEVIAYDSFGKPAYAKSYADGKTYTVYEVKDGQITIKGKQYPIKLKDGFYIIRKLTVLECMRLQTVPEWYKFPVSDSQAYKMLGNGWTVEVIAHILQGLK